MSNHLNYLTATFGFIKPIENECITPIIFMIINLIIKFRLCAESVCKQIGLIHLDTQWKIKKNRIINIMDEQHLLILASSIYACALISYKSKKTLSNRRNRKLWIKPWHERRQEGKSVLHMLNEELLIEDPAAYRNFLRMTGDQFNNLLQSVKPLIDKQDTIMRPCVSARNRLEVTLRLLATGDTYRSLMYATRIHESTISLFVPKVIGALIVVLKNYVKTPSSCQEWQAIADDFNDLWQFPQCVGALDGRHIKFRPLQNRLDPTILITSRLIL